MRARCVISEKLDRAETVGKMDGQRAARQPSAGRRRAESSDEDEKSPNHLDNDRSPAQKKCEWHTHRVQDADEVVETASEFGIAVLEKSVAHNQSKRDCKPILRNRERRESEPSKERFDHHRACFEANVATVTVRGFRPTLTFPRGGLAEGFAFSIASTTARRRAPVTLSLSPHRGRSPRGPARGG